MDKIRFWKWLCSLQIFYAIILTEQDQNWDSSHADFPSEEISSRSDFALLSFGEKPCPLSPLRGFLTPIPHPVQMSCVNIIPFVIPAEAGIQYYYYLNSPVFLVAKSSMVASTISKTSFFKPNL